MMRNHEAIVHFPIALFLSAFLFALIGIFYKRGLFKELVFWNLLLGILATMAAIYSGFIEGEQIHDRHLDETLELHRRNAYIVCALIFCLTFWLGFRKKSMQGLEYIAWIALFFIASASVTYQGFKGHEMSSKIQEFELQSIKSKLAPKALDYGWNF